MSLPNLVMRLIPNKRCGRCGQLGYVHERTGLCLSCTNIGLLRWAKWKMNEDIDRRSDATSFIR